MPGPYSTGIVLTGPQGAPGQIAWLNERETFLTDPDSVDPAGDDLVWTYESGPALLDLTDPQLPVVLTSGLYMVTAQVVLYDLTPGGFATASLGILDSTNHGLYTPSSELFPLDGDGTNTAICGLTFTAYVVAGSKFEVLMFSTVAAPFNVVFTARIQLIAAG